MEANELEDARQTLGQIEERLHREVGEMTRVLAADVPAFFLRSVRRVFERSAEADAMADPAVAALKQDAQETGQELGAEVARELEPFETWSWDPAWTLPAEAPEDLEAHPRVAAVLGRVGEALGQLLERHGLPARPEETAYRLPAYFVAGHFMKSLVANYWRALADYEALRRSLAEADQSEARERRAARWDHA